MLASFHGFNNIWLPIKQPAKLPKNCVLLKAHSHRLLEPQHWISTLPFDLIIELSRLTVLLNFKWNFKVLKCWQERINIISSIVLIFLRVFFSIHCGLAISMNIFNYGAIAKKKFKFVSDMLFVMAREASLMSS